MKNEKNSYRNVLQREYTSKFARRYSLHAFKAVCLEKEYKYRKVWSAGSIRNITSEYSRIYFDNYTKVFGGYKLDNGPKLLYTLRADKIENALTCASRMPYTRLPYEGEKDCIICVTKNNILMRVHLTAGRILQQVFLAPSTYRFRDISWNEANSSIVVRSTKVHSNREINVVKVLAVFDVKPLTFIGMMKICYKEFGKDTTDVIISSNLLITMHQQCGVKMYSFPYILDQYRTEICDLNDVIDDVGNRLGQHPIGLKFNIIITECPPVLFKISCYDHLLEFSDKPYHYIFSPAKTPEHFEVHSLEYGALVWDGKVEKYYSQIVDVEMFCEFQIREGILQKGTLGYSEERCKAAFWDDNSGRVMHISTSTVSFYEVIPVPCTENDERMLKWSFDISLDRGDKREYVPYTSSGRRVNRPNRQDSIDGAHENVTIYNVDYEDDLDIICVTAVYQNFDDPKGVICFYDNYTGRLLKEVDIIEPKLDVNEHRTFIDLDTIIQINKLWSGNYSCVMYRLTCEIDEDEKGLKTGNQSKRNRQNHCYQRTRNR